MGRRRQGEAGENIRIGGGTAFFVLEGKVESRQTLRIMLSVSVVLASLANILKGSVVGEDAELGR